MFDPGLMDMVMRLRSRGIYDTNVLRAFETVPRKYFVPDDMWDKAYDELSLPIACGQSISEPLVAAMMCQALDVKQQHKLLEIGTGSGYHAAILSRLCRRVYSAERYHRLVNEAEARFTKLGINNIVTRHSDGRYGWKGQAPFDRIILTCGVDKIPKGLIDQLGRGGRIVAVIKGELVAYSSEGMRVILPMNLPMIEAGKSQVL